MKKVRRLGWVVLAGLFAWRGRLVLAQDLDLSVSNVRATLKDQRAFLAAHPKDPAASVALAYTLSDAGMNDLAIETMNRATEVTPSSALAFSAKAWVLRHNSVGEDFGKGFNYDQTLACYRKAIVLNPNDMDTRQSLAEVLQRNRDGVDYGSGADMAAAIETYHYVKSHSHPVSSLIEENLAIALFYSGLFQEAVTEIASLPPTTPYSEKLKAVQVAAVTALHGSAAGIAATADLPTPERKKESLVFAAEGLWNVRLYSQAADLLSASLPNPEVKGIAAKVELFRQLKPFHRDELPEGDPRRPVQRLFSGIVLGTLTKNELAECVVPALLRSEGSPEDSLKQIHALTAMLQSLSKKTGLPIAVVEDLILGNLKIRTVDSSQPGARVVLSNAGTGQMQFFILKEQGMLKIASDGSDLAPIGTEALHLLRDGREQEAISLLNWRRDLLTNSQTKDPLGGSLFGRAWSSGESKGRAAIEMAAASVLSDPAQLKSLLPTAQAEVAREAPEFVHNTSELILARLYLESGDVASGSKLAERMLARYPDSVTAQALMGRAFELNHDWTAWRSLVEKGAANHPQEKAFLLAGVRQAEAEGDFGRAMQQSRKILDSERVDAKDEARYARMSVFAGQAGEEAQQAAQRALLASKAENVEYLTTAAWVNASLGHTAEARELLLDAMRSAEREEPNSEVWFGFGRIFEQYGEAQAAIAAYRRAMAVTPGHTEGELAIAAQRRLQALQ